MNVENRIYLTFDMDWACDEVMVFLYDLLDKHDICATVNITNSFSNIERFKNDEKIELGIHPNFNFIINGNGDGNNKETIIRQCKKVVPEAIIARSHSLLNSTSITTALYDYGIRYEMNYFIAPYEGICVYPWLRQGVLQIPFFYEDDLYLLENYDYTPQFYLSKNIKMCKVFNFHPIHLFLNSESLNRYQGIKDDYHNYDILKKNINTQRYGTLDFFEDFIFIAQKKGYSFEPITKILETDN